jgi:hypothetical protein
MAGRAGLSHGTLGSPYGTLGSPYGTLGASIGADGRDDTQFLLATGEPLEA